MTEIWRKGGTVHPLCRFLNSVLFYHFRVHDACGVDAAPYVIYGCYLYGAGLQDPVEVPEYAVRGGLLVYSTLLKDV
jgi:hypothetical protein